MEKKLASAILGLLCTASLSGSAATAQTISGSYVFRLTILCQETLRQFKDPQGDVINIVPNGSGLMEMNMGTAAFNPNTQKVRITGFSVGGNIVRVLGKPSTAVHEEPISLTLDYSNTATTLTIGADTYRVVYAEVRNGIARQVYFQGVTTQGCAEQGSAIRK